MLGIFRRNPGETLVISAAIAFELYHKPDRYEAALSAASFAITIQMIDLAKPYFFQIVVNRDFIPIQNAFRMYVQLA